MDSRSLCKEASSDGANRKEKVEELFERHRERLRFAVSLRMDRRVRGRVDTADVLRESCLEARKRFPDGRSEGSPSSPSYFWLRRLAMRKLRRLQRFYLGARARDAHCDVDFRGADVPQPTSEALAARLLDRSTTPSEAAVCAESRQRLRQALDGLSPGDREIIALRHFELLSNEETARILGIASSAVSRCHARALLRLGAMLELP